MIDVVCQCKTTCSIGAGVWLLESSEQRSITQRFVGLRQVTMGAEKSGRKKIYAKSFLSLAENHAISEGSMWRGTDDHHL